MLAEPAIAQTLPIPVKFIGVGEGVDDLRPFRVGRDSLAPITELPLLPLEVPKPAEPPKLEDAPLLNPLAPKKPGGGR